jgi:tetratricopeptide (TPR) repeat protein
LSALSGVDDQQLEPILTALVRQEILTIQADPRSPERGNYVFLQALVQKVAHEMLSRRERKTRHLAAAEYFVTSWGADEEEIVEVVASHYLEAYECDPQADDARAIKAKAGEHLTRAGERAASLAAHAEAQGYFDRAAELRDDPIERAQLLNRAGTAAETAGRLREAIERLKQAVALFESGGQTHLAARASAHLGAALFHEGEIDAGVERMEASFAILAGDEPDEDLATLAAQLARLHFFRGALDRASERVEFALAIAEALWLPEVLSDALNTKHLVLESRGRLQEAIGLLKYSLELALANDKPGSATRAYINLAHIMAILDRYDEALALDRRGLELARQLGQRIAESYFLHHLCGWHYFAGEWDEALAIVDDMKGSGIRERDASVLFPGAYIWVNRGEVDLARAALQGWESQPADLQERAGLDLARSVVMLAEGHATEALEAAEAAFAYREAGGVHTFAKEGFVVAVEAALALDDLHRADRLLADVRALPPGLTPPFLRAQSARFEASLAAKRGEHDRVEPSFEAAVHVFRELGLPFWIAVTLLEQSESLIENGRTADAEERLAEARSIFERLKARPWLERLERAAKTPAELAAT